MNKKTIYSVCLAALLMLVVVGCNDFTDDPEISNNLVNVSSFSPLSACVDYDGELVDTDGDGTTDTTVFTSVVQDVSFDSRVRGGGGSTFNDVIFTSVNISYSVTGGTAPPPRNETITVTVPAGGSASVPVTSVIAGDIPGNFGATTRGNIVMTFSGADASGEPASATGRTPIETANICN